MLVIRQKDGQPLVVGDIVLVLTRDGNDIEVCVDAPASVGVKRGDLLERDLDRAGFSRVRDNKWKNYKGAVMTVRQALASIGALG